jgi:hypothetical protein
MGNKNSGRKKDPRVASRRDVIIDLWQKAYSLEEIAEQLGCARQTCSTVVSDYGLSDLKVSRHWLKTSGIGDKWDETCRKLREA